MQAAHQPLAHVASAATTASRWLSRKTAFAAHVERCCSVRAALHELHHSGSTIRLQLPAALDGAGGDVHEGSLLCCCSCCEHRSAGVEQCSACKRAVHGVGWRPVAPAVELLRSQLCNGGAAHVVDDLLADAMFRPHCEVVLTLCQWQLAQRGRGGRLRAQASGVGLVVSHAVANRVDVSRSGVRSHMLELH